MNDEAHARERLLSILAQMTKRKLEYTAGADIFDDYELDSLDQIEFLFNVESEFGVKIEDETFEERGLRSFDRLAAFLAGGGR